jgi:hypothetical protein
MEKIREIIVGTIVDFVIIFSPVILSTVGIYYYSQNNVGWSNSIINRLSHINGNFYTINNILLVFIIASYLTIFIGLNYYFNGFINDLSKYNGKDDSVVKLNKLSSKLLIFVNVLLILYISALFFSCSDHIRDGDKFFNFDNLVIVNKSLSFFMFFIFLLADLVSWQSNFLQRKENEVILKQEPTNKEAKVKIEHNNNEITLARNATFLINVPVLIITSLSILFTYLIHEAVRFRSIVDQQLNYMEVPYVLYDLCYQGSQWGSKCAYPKPLNENLFELFLNGVETGVITVTILISQWIFIILRAVWKFKKLKIGLD